MGWTVDIVGNAPRVIAAAVSKSKASLNRAVWQAASKVLAQAKVNVKGTLNTTGQSKGTLGRSLKIVPDKANFRAAVGPQVVYGAIHEFGGTIRNGWGRGILIKIPQRAYLQPALDTAQPAIAKIFANELGGVFDE